MEKSGKNKVGYTMPNAISTPEDIIAASFCVLGDIIADADEFERDIHSISERIRTADYDELDGCFASLQDGYDNTACLQIAGILMQASKLPFQVNGIHYLWRDSAYRQKPALYFYELAAQHDDPLALYEAGCIHTHGYGDIIIDKEKANDYWRRSADLGNIDALYSLKLDENQVEYYAEKGMNLANILLYKMLFDQGKKFKARGKLKLFIQTCTDEEMKKAIQFLQTRGFHFKGKGFGSKYSSGIDYLKKHGKCANEPTD